MTTSKYRSVLEILLPVSKEFIAFSPTEHKYATNMVLHRSTWEEIGSPSEITITVEPGDLLNQEVTDV